MPWADVSIDADLVDGLALAVHSIRDANRGGEFDVTNITDSNTKAAKEVFKDELLDPGTGNLVPLINTFASIDAFLDAVVDNAKLNDIRNRTLAYAWLHVFMNQKRNSARSIFAEDAERFYMQMLKSMRALKSTIPAVIEIPENTYIEASSSVIIQTKASYGG